MSLSELRASFTRQVIETLEADHWTAFMLSEAAISDLTKYTGIGKVTAQKLIDAAQVAMNAHKLEEAERLDRQAYLKNAPPILIFQEMEQDGWTLLKVALANPYDLLGARDMDIIDAARVITWARDEVNAQGLVESKQLATGGGQQVYFETNSAFPEEWLSGEVEPPPMSIRVKRNFEKAQTIWRERHNR